MLPPESLLLVGKTAERQRTVYPSLEESSTAVYHYITEAHFLKYRSYDSSPGSLPLSLGPTEHVCNHRRIEHSLTLGYLFCAVLSVLWRLHRLG
jgi:hypothetical protein